MTGATSVALGGDFACALLDNESVRCWGEGGLGQLGDGSATSANVAVRVDGPALTTLTCGAAHACGVDRLGDVWCWGSNDRGQLTGEVPARALRPTRLGSL